MLKIFLLSICAAVVIAHDGKSKIAGGINVGKTVGKKVINSGEFPFIAQIKLRKMGFKYLLHCTACIIAPYALLTAAHCLDGRSPEDFIIFAGNVRKLRPKSVTQDRRVQKFVIHNDYKITYLPPRNDIGIIFLTQPFETTEFVSPIKYWSAFDYEAGLMVTSIGWGLNENGDKPKWLQKTDLSLISNNDCQKFLNQVSNSKWKMTNDMVCAINQNNSAACVGDSGGPLVYKNRLIGTNSFSFTISNKQDGELKCDTFYPSGFVRLSNYINWIDRTLLAGPKFI